MPAAWQITYLTHASDVRRLKLTIKTIVHMAWTLRAFYRSTTDIYELVFSYIMALGVGLNCYKSQLVISTLYKSYYDEFKFSFWYNEVFSYHVKSLFYLCCSLLE